VSFLKNQLWSLKISKRATHPHEILMMNLSVFHLLLPVAALSSGYISTILTLALIGSLLTLSFIAKKSRSCAADPTESALVQAHWQQAWKRSKLLLVGYAISIAIMLIGWGLGSLQSDPKRLGILLVVVSRIAVVPTVLIVFALFVLSTFSVARAKQDEFPKE